MPTTILIVQNRINGLWDYGPELLRKIMQFDSDGGLYATASKAKSGALADASIPRPVQFVVIPKDKP